MGFFRIGSEDYAVTNETYGLATMLKAHVTLLDDGDAALRLPGQARQAPGPVGRRRRTSTRSSSASRRAAAACPSCSPTSEGRRWVDVRSPDINAYLKDVTGLESRAKDFRTWNATVLAAVALAVCGLAQQATKTGRKRAVVRAIKEVAHYLGNTPAVARASYIDPRVFDRFNDGLTIEPDLAVTRSRSRRSRARSRRRCSTSSPTTRTPTA